MNMDNWPQLHRAVSLDNKHQILKKSLGVYPGIIDIIIFLDCWLILDFEGCISLIDKEWKILDLKTGRVDGPFHPIDQTGSPRSWVEIDAKETIYFCWSEGGSAGHSVFDLNTGTSSGSFIGNGGPPELLELVNGVLIADAGKYVRLSERIEESRFFDAFPKCTKVLVNKALGDCLLVTLEQETYEVSAWYIG